MQRRHTLRLSAPGKQVVKTETSPTVEALDLLPDEVNITFIASLFAVRRATASQWAAQYALQYRKVGNSKMIPKLEVVRLAQIRNAK